MPKNYLDKQKKKSQFLIKVTIDEICTKIKVSYLLRTLFIDKLSKKGKEKNNVLSIK